MIEYLDNYRVLNQVPYDIKCFVISATCEYISNECCKDRTSLISFSFEENSNLTTIGTSSFEGCTSLTIINLSSCHKLTKISVRAFYYCYRVSKILLPEGLLEIGSYSFSQNRLIKDVVIPASVEIIGYRAFSYCYDLEYFKFEEGSNLTTLESCIFLSTNIASFQIPEKVNIIRASALANYKLTNVSIHERNNNFGILDKVLFSKSKSILLYNIDLTRKSYKIPDYVITLAIQCFAGSNITNITIPPNVKIIENYAFVECHDLINVTILSPLYSIGDYIFDGCFNLERVIFPNSSMTVNYGFLNTQFTPKVRFYFTCKILFKQRAVNDIINVSISHFDKQNLIINHQSLIMDLEQTIIYEYWGYLIDNITIPNSVRIIRERAFENSTIHVVEFEENSNIREIQNYAFQNCQTLDLFTVSSPSSLFIGTAAFKNCSYLTLVKFKSNNVTFSNNTFEGCNNLSGIINITNVPNWCFYNCEQLSNVTILEGSTHIKDYSFFRCTSLTSLNIPSSIRVIENLAFCNCFNLRSLTFAATNNLEYISFTSFSSCKSLNSISDFNSNYFQCIKNTIYDNRDNRSDLIFHASDAPEKILEITCKKICGLSFKGAPVCTFI